jgi:hypothetical protein
MRITITTIATMATTAATLMTMSERLLSGTRSSSDTRLSTFVTSCSAYDADLAP